MKKLLSILLSGVMMITFLTGCTSTGGDDVASDEYHIAIITPTLSGSEDEYRAGQEMAKKYPQIVKHLTLPENFTEEIETGISTIVSTADDPLMKAVVVVSGQSGLIPAYQQIKEKNPDIFTISAPIFDEPEMMSEYIDLNLDTNWLERGRTIVEKANEMGAKTFIHYSFPTHLSKPLILARKDKMQETCEKLGIEFIELTTPDPQTGDSVEAMQQFLQEDIPRQIEKYGEDTNIFGSNCGMYDVILKEALNLKYMVAEQCCPTPTQAYPTVLGLEISEEDKTDFDKINEMISEKVAEAGMSGKLSGWPISATVYMPEFAVEVAKAVIEEDFDCFNAQNLNDLTKEKFGVEVDFTKLEDNGNTYDNFFVMIMDSILY